MSAREEARTAREAEILTLEAGTYTDMLVAQAIGWFVDLLPIATPGEPAYIAVRTGSASFTDLEIYGLSGRGKFNPSSCTDDAFQAIAAPCFGNHVFDSILCPHMDPLGGLRVGASVRLRYALTPPGECSTPYVWAPTPALAIARCILLNKERNPYYRQEEIEQEQRARFVMKRRPRVEEVVRCAPGWTNIQVRQAWAGFYAMGTPPDGGPAQEVPAELWRASFHA